jgi:hypothetical protein
MEKLKMRYTSKIAILACAYSVFSIAVAAQTPAPAKKPATPGKAPASKTAYDPALMHPATLTAKAPAEYEVKFVTTQANSQ